jgi:hypothetical protein
VSEWFKPRAPENVIHNLQTVHDIFSKVAENDPDLDAIAEIASLRARLTEAAGLTDAVGMSQSADDPQALILHFRRPVTDADRTAVLRMINTLIAPPQPSGKAEVSQWCSLCERKVFPQDIAECRHICGCMFAQPSGKGGE